VSPWPPFVPERNRPWQPLVRDKGAKGGGGTLLERDGSQRRGWHATGKGLREPKARVARYWKGMGANGGGARYWKGMGANGGGARYYKRKTGIPLALLSLVSL